MRAEAEAAPPWTCATPALSPIREHRPMESGMAQQVSVPARARQVAVRSLAALFGGFLATLCLAGLPAAAQSDAAPKANSLPKTNPLNAVVGVRATVPATARSARPCAMHAAAAGVGSATKGRM